jgi:3-hydroxyanthranilate 3,4-dioxygenase
MVLKELKIINTSKWIEENQASFLPPVCNKLMHNEQLVIMFVGGPNQREDYHIEEGEELFYQLKGDMCVKILENGQHKDVHIKEGEFFLLPARVPHSPQRTANSIGLVIERRRQVTEKDGVRWFVPNSDAPLYEKWFHCKDLGIELIPLIKAYFASEEFATKVSKDNVVDKKDLPYELNPVQIDKNLHGPYSLNEKLNSLRKEESQLSNQHLNLTPRILNMQFSVEIYSKGDYELNLDDSNLDVWLWQLEGTSSLELQNTNNAMQQLIFIKHDSLLVHANTFKNVSFKLSDEKSFLMKVIQNPSLKK